MNCEQAKERFADYWEGSLDPAAAAEYQSHLGSCPACQEEAASLTEVWRNLGLIPVEQPGAAMRPRFYQSLEAYQQGLEQAKAPAPGAARPRWIWRMPAMQFAFGALILLVGIGVGHVLTSERGRGPAAASPEVAQLQNEVQTMRQMVTLALMQQQSASERLKGVTLSSQVDLADGQVLAALMYALNHDQNVNVRLASVDALRKFSASPLVRKGLDQSLAEQDSPMVQIALIDLMVDLKDKGSAPTLASLAGARNINSEVKERAEWGLKQLR